MKQPLIQPHPDTYCGFPFITLLVDTKNQSYLCIVDNINKKYYKVYVIDYCDRKNCEVDEEEFITLAEDWWDNHKDIPFSVYTSSKHKSKTYCNIARTFPVQALQRVIGPVQEYPIQPTIPKKTRRRKPIPVDI